MDATAQADDRIDLLVRVVEDVYRLLDARLQKGGAAASAAPAGGGGGGLLGSLSGVLGTLAAVTGALAALAAAVQVVDPQLVAQFGLALKTLTAGIGYALAPIIDAATVVVNELARQLAPAFRALRPVIAQLASVLVPILSSLGPVLADQLIGLAETVSSLMPIIRGLAFVVETLTTGFLIVVNLFNAFVTGLNDIQLGMGGLDKVIKDARTAVVDFYVAVIKATYGLLQLVGLGNVAERFRKSFTRSRDPGDGIAPAPTGFGVSSIEDVMRKRLVAAASAGQGATGVDKTNSILAEIGEKIAGVSDSWKDLRKGLMDDFSEIIAGLQRALVAKLNEIGGYLSNPQKWFGGRG